MQDESSSVSCKKKDININVHNLQKFGVGKMFFKVFLKSLMLIKDAFYLTKYNKKGEMLNQ